MFTTKGVFVAREDFLLWYDLQGDYRAQASSARAGINHVFVGFQELFFGGIWRRVRMFLWRGSDVSVEAVDCFNVDIDLQNILETRCLNTCCLIRCLGYHPPSH